MIIVTELGAEGSGLGASALDDVSLDLRAGEVHALMGENGAGKSTLVKCLTGADARDAGTVRLGGTPIFPTSVADLDGDGDLDAVGYMDVGFFDFRPCTYENLGSGTFGPPLEVRSSSILPVQPDRVADLVRVFPRQKMPSFG